LHRSMRPSSRIWSQNKTILNLNSSGFAPLAVL
jgi:hypothetical protein